MQKSLLFFFIPLLLSSFLMLFFVRRTITEEVKQEQKHKPAHEFSVAIAPKQSLRGTLLSSFGEIKWQSRTASEPAVLTDTSQKIQQGEILETGKNARFTLALDKAATISATENSEIELSQTLPENIVLRQPQGTVTYTSTKNPVSVRALHLLVSHQYGIVTIARDEDTALISVSVRKGNATLAYNDLENISHVLEVTAGKSVEFDDDLREIGSF